MPIIRIIIAKWRRNHFIEGMATTIAHDQMAGSSEEEEGKKTEEWNRYYSVRHYYMHVLQVLRTVVLYAYIESSNRDENEAKKKCFFFSNEK